MPVIPTNMTVFAFPTGSTAIKSYTYRREGEGPFFPTQDRFQFPRILPAPPQGIHPTKGFCVLNRNGANNGSTIDIFVRTLGNDIRWNTSQNGGGAWGGWVPLGGTSVLTSAPAAASYGSEFLVLIVKGADGHLYRRFKYPNQPWTNWININPPSGRTIPGDPAVIGAHPNSFRVYIRADNNHIYEKIFNNESEGSWQDMTAAFGNNTALSDPEGVELMHDEPNPGNPPTPEEGFNVFYKGTANQMRLAHYFPSGPFSNYDWAGGLTSAAGAAYFKGKIEVPDTGQDFKELHTFVRGLDNLVYGRYASLVTFSGVNPPPSGWYSLGGFGTIDGKPDVVTWKGQV